MLQVISAGTDNLQELPVARPACFRHGYFRLTVQISRCQGIGLQHFGRCSGKDHFAAQPSCPRTHIDDIIGIQHHVFIVFHHDHRVAQVAQLFQRMNQPRIIPLVQTDTRLIEDIEHIHQLASDLRCQSDTLTFSARQTSRRTVQRQIIQSDFEEEIQARTDFLQDFDRDRPLLSVEFIFQSVEPFLQLRNVHRGQLGNVLPGDAVMQGFLIQALTFTLRTDRHLDKLPCPLLGRSRSVHLLLHHNIFGHTLIRKEITRRIQQFSLDLQRLVGSVHDLVHRFLRYFADRRLECQAIFLTYRFDLPEDQCILIFSQCHDTAVIDAHRRIGHDFLHIQQIDLPQSLTLRTGALRRIEREVMRSRLAVRKSRYRVHQPLAVMTCFARIRIQYEDESVALLHRHLQAFLEPALVAVGNNQLVDHHFHIVHLVAVEFHPVDDLAHRAIPPYIQIAFLAQLFEQLLIMSLTVANHRRQNVGALSLVAFEDQMQHLFFGIFHHLLPAQVRPGFTGPGIQQTQEIVYFGSRSHGRTRVLVCCFLLDRDDRTQPGDLIHVRAFHISQEIPRIGREILHITTLPFGKERIECQRRLAAAAHPRNHRQCITRNLDVYILQIVNPCSPDGNFSRF